jgi:uncharacterized protein (TIGR01619 family)
MKNICRLVLVVLFTCPALVQAQDNWDTYIAQYDDGPGSTTLNMARKETAPVSTLPFVVVTGLTTRNCEADGFPAKKELGKLQAADDAVLATVLSAAAGEPVGTFLHQCERLSYIYVKDTLRIREKLIKLYKTKYSDYTYYINIKPDKEWEYYLEFLYPNDEVMEYMSNEKVIAQLEQAGDKLDKARSIDYTFYFAEEKGREAFVQSIATQGFRVTDESYVKEDPDQPYQLILSRVGMVELSEISQTTLELKKKAEQFGGGYDGWNTILVK